MSLFLMKCLPLDSDLTSSGQRNSVQAKVCEYGERGQVSHIHLVTSEFLKGKIRHYFGSLWRPKRNRFKICSTTYDLATGLISRSVQKQRSNSNWDYLKIAFFIGLFAFQNDRVARSNWFSVPPTNPDNNWAQGLLCLKVASCDIEESAAQCRGNEAGTCPVRGRVLTKGKASQFSSVNFFV